MNPPEMLFDAGLRVARLGLRTAAVPIAAGAAVERRLRPVVTSAATDAGTRLLDAVLQSGALDTVLDHIEASGVSRDLARRVLADGIADQVIAGALESGQLEATLLRAMDSEAARNGIANALESPTLERLLERGLDSPGSQRLLSQVMASPLLEEAISQLLESPELWVMVDEIARSPSVTEAITHQSVGFADQIAGTVREGSRDADAWLEKAARRIVPHRRGRAKSNGVKPLRELEPPRTDGQDARAASNGASDEPV